MKWIDRIVKKGKDPQAVYLTVFYANDKQFVESLSDDQRKWLVKHIRSSKPDQCICCPCFAWEFGEDKEIKGCSCTLGGIPKAYDEGQCNF